eukprot:ANDGO_08331.mRNA.1 Putative calcium-transporting ATPase 11
MSGPQEAATVAPAVEGQSSTAQGPFGISVSDLSQLSLERDVASLRELDADPVAFLAAKLCTDLDNGISADKESDQTAEAIAAFPHALHDGYDYRRTVFGANRYAEQPSASFLQLLWEAFEDLMLRILTGLACVSLALELGFHDGGGNGWIEPVAIMIAVLLVAFVTAGNNYSKERQFKALNKVKENRLIKVIRGGKRAVISTHDLCVGDVIILDSGDQVPADGVLIDGFNVATDESAMTGETDLVKKSRHDAPFLLSGTQVADGTGRMLVLAVGENSEWGLTVAKLVKDPEDTPLQIKLDALATQIGKAGFVVAILVFLVLAISYTIRASTNDSWSGESSNAFVNFFLISVTIVVVAVPEGLPLAVTIALAYSMKKMMKDNNFVRHLSACETMGGATTICSDKTGTLTENRMTVVKGYFAGEFFDNEEFPKTLPSERVHQLLCEGIAVNTKAVVAVKEDGRPDFVGNKTECALLWLVQKHFDSDWDAIRKLHKNAVRQVYTFSSDRKRMSTIISLQPNGGAGANVAGPKFRLYSKGASEIVLGLCSKRMTPSGSVVEITAEDRAQLEELIVKMASQGLRTICLAFRDFAEDGGDNWTNVPVSVSGEPSENDPESKMTCIAIVGIKDPLRKEVYEAVRQCRASGIVVRMCTGDNILTAKHIARECGILTDDGVAMEGRVFRNMTDEERDRVLPNLQVLARSTPSDKFIFVNRLRTLGEVVAVTGDGTNDAPALKEADVGLSMGLSGTEVAKEASDIVILDDNFSSIVKAVLWGRSVYENIRKFLSFQMTVNFVALTTVFIAALAQRDLPLTVIQLLWVNLIMDTFAALALATEPPSPALLERKPYGRYDPLITSVMLRNVVGQGAYQITMSMTLLFAGHKLIPGVTENSIELTTIIFNSFVFCQLFNELNARRIADTDGWDANIFAGLTPAKSPLFFLIWFSTVLIQALIVEFGGVAIQTTGLTVGQWWGCIIIGFISLPLGVLIRCIPVPPRKVVIPKEILEMRERAIAAGAKAALEPSKSTESEEVPMVSHD